ncbi:uncharacterized protein LOC129786890 [Lutzomyia longipalpis]|uniref:uncharacterized protein LOC129786890 n=1 Tax=Lutzomyia longipalpis TaxID=7200 RepID=UPI0024835B92|nr:uncharacterized protein LOC129786890 [Lutzomyia longipalpis]
MKNIPLFLTILISLLDLRVNGNKSDGEKHEREKRFLAFPINSATGVLVALAIPLIIPHRNVFVSYNFEANYNMPTMASDLIPGPLDRLEIIDRSFGEKTNGDSADSQSNQDAKEVPPTTEKTKIESTEKKRSKRSSSDGLFSRKKIYIMLESKLRSSNSHGHRGRACLLRAICEEAQEPINDHNGLIGDIIHIILTPSTSVREDIHPEYYRAEEFGHKGDCSRKLFCM